MSLQVCHCCGWSKTTTYHGLRVHQGKMGCTPKGLRIPESEQFNYRPKFTYLGPPIKVEEPFVFNTYLKSDTSSDTSLQVCHCGWSKTTTYHGLRVHQGMMGCTPKGLRIPESEQYLWRNQLEEPRQKDSKPISSPTVEDENVLVSPSLINEVNPAVIELMKALVETQQNSQQLRSSMDKIQRALGFDTGAQALTTQTNPAAAQPTLKETSNPFFETPQRSHQSSVRSDKARRALDFPADAHQVERLWELPTTTAQETVIHPKEKGKDKEKEAQKLLKAKQDRKKADLWQKIYIREHTVAEVRSSVGACKGSLDAEWLEINNVFSEVMRAVEDARQKALKPLEERRQKVKREAQDLVQNLQREIEILKQALNELDKNPDLQIYPLKGLDESADWKNVSVDTSFSFGTLRATTSPMMKRIQQEVEKLSSVEIKRISAFAVDVKLDSTTAHQCLLLSDDGKQVRDVGRKPNLPDAPERFDMFGSVLGLNSLTSGKSYWEVEVSNKTGWELGVARRSANRKGTLTLNPGGGYWATVHYEGEKYAALTAPPVRLSLSEKPKKVGVFVDYEGGLVSFYDVTAQSHIYSFTECSFGDEIRPYFSPHLKQSEKNADPLIISAVQKE